MWMGIKAQDKEFLSDMTPEFRDRLNALCMSGARVTYDFVFHHYEFLYLMNGRRTQNDRHYSHVTLRDNKSYYNEYPPGVVRVEYLN